MGMSLSDYAISIRNSSGQNPPTNNKDKKGKPLEDKRGKTCCKCGLRIRSALVTSVLFKGDHCIDCVKEMNK